MDLAPIVLFTYNRPEHTQRTLEALNNCTLAEQSHLYIFSDGPKPNATKKDLYEIGRVRSQLKLFNWSNNYKVIYRPTNIGLAENIKSGYLKS